MPLTTYTAGEVLTAASLNDNFSFASSNGGLVCVKAETAFSAVADVTADGVFTSAYTNYRILLRYFCSTTGDVDMRFRVATVDTSANYNYQRITASSTTISTLNTNGTGSAQIGQDTNGTFFSLSTIEISGVQLAEPTNYQSLNTRTLANYTTGAGLQQFFGNQSDSTAFDGIKFLVTTGTFTGSYTIYGYSKAV